MRILAATGMVAGIAYIFTPLTASGQPYDGSGFDANLRYVSPVLMVGFLLLPLIPWFRHGRRPWILIGLFTVLLIQGTVIQSNWEFKHHLASIGLAFLIVGVPALLVAGSEGASVRCCWSSFGLVMVFTAVALGRVRENYYLDHRYVTASRPPLGGGFRASPEWQPLQDWGRNASHQRIGVFGRASAFGQYFFYGNDLSNYVQYLGDEGRPRHVPADLHLRPLAPDDQPGPLRLRGDDAGPGGDRDGARRPRTSGPPAIRTCGP